jgi:hypothetical protein
MNCRWSKKKLSAAHLQSAKDALDELKASEDRLKAAEQEKLSGMPWLKALTRAMRRRRPWPPNTRCMVSRLMLGISR